MKFKLLATLAIVPALFLGANSAWAYGSEAGEFSVGPGVGAYFFDGDAHLATATLPNLNLGYNFTDNWGIEALGGYGRTESNNNGYSGDDVDATYLALDGVYHFTNCTNFEPFVMAGIGALNLDPVHGLTDGNPLINNPRTTANVNAGVGAQYFFSKMTSLRLDVRDIYNTTSESNNQNDILANLSVVFHFGGK